MTSKCKQLRALIESNTLEFILEAHNGISATIVEQAGFKAIWGSGFAMSAQFGVRDSNEASWTQVVDMLEFMSDATSIPILLDGDTGYGNFNNMRRLVSKLEQREIAGVCIEDKQFPKINSFIDSNKQPLADIDEFSGKIKAGKDCQADDDFCIIARVEALIAGWGLKEALDRAEAYRMAGADGILIHSKSHRPDEILEFAKEWSNRLPLAIVPTKYYSTPTNAFRKANISLVIWANHMIRSSTKEMIKFEKNRFMRAGVILAVISSAISHPKIPKWEMYLSCGALCQNLLNASIALGYGAQWVTEWYSYNKKLLQILGGDSKSEKFAGFIYIGKMLEKPIERRRADLDEIVTNIKL